MPNLAEQLFDDAAQFQGALIFDTELSIIFLQWLNPADFKYN